MVKDELKDKAKTEDEAQKYKHLDGREKDSYAEKMKKKLAERKEIRRVRR